MSLPPEALTCAEVLGQLEPFADGELDRGESAAVERHLASCESCSRELELAFEVTRRLRAMPRLCAPERVLQSVRRETTARPAWRRAREPLGALAARPMLAAAAATVLLGLLLGTVLWRSHTGSVPGDEAVARATAEARLALAVVATISRNAALDLGSQLIGSRVVTPTIRQIIKTTQTTSGPSPGAQPERRATNLVTRRSS